MHFSTIILCCSLFSSIAGFTLLQDDSENPLSIFMNDGCQCKNGRCVKDNRGKTKCNCKRGYALQDENTCELCDCGEKGKCMFIGLSESSGGRRYIKKCVCDLGSEEKDGVCIDCQCGENSKCEFEDGEKVCYCIEGYAEKDGVCTKCDCGPDGECTFNNGQKMCTCYEDFVENNGYCTHKCHLFDCKNGGMCKIENEAAVCECRERFDGKQCEIDKCNSINCHNGGTCEIRNGEPVCKCQEKFTGNDCLIDKCTKIKCRNGGLCNIHGGEPICNCPTGYYGNECEIDCDKGTCKKTQCKCCPGYGLRQGTIYIPPTPDTCKKCDCGQNFNCTFNHRGKRCICPAGSVDKLGVCKVKCNSVNTCKNGGRCQAGRIGSFCKCVPGTSGDLCDIVDGCKKNPLLCGDERHSGARCVFDAKRKSPSCRCTDKNLKFDKSSMKCREN